MPPPIEVPPFPLASLVPWQRELVEALARSSQTDPTMAAVSSLGVLSAAIANKTSVTMPSGLVVPLHLWVTVVAGPGESKSRVFGVTSRPLAAIQERLENPGPVQPRPVFRPSIYERILNDPLEGAAVCPGPLTPSTNMEEAVQMVWRRQFDSPNADAAPVVITNDITPTRLFDLLGEQASPVTLLSPEAGFDAWLRNSQVAIQEQAALNQVWDGENVRRHRRDRIIILRRPALAMVVGMQPHPASELVSNRRLRGSGYSLRTVWAVPEPTLGLARAPFAPLASSVADAYNAHVWHLMMLGGPEAMRRQRVMQASRAASALYDDFFNRSQPRIRPGGDLEAIGDYVTRLRTNVLRMAGVLHVARWAARLGDQALSRDIDEESMAGAVTMAETLFHHGRLVFERLAGDPEAIRTTPVQRRTFLDALGVVVPEQGWDGRASDLLALVQESVPEHERAGDWPGAANALSRWLGRSEALLARHNLAVTVRRTDRGSSISLRRTSSTSSSSSEGA